MQTYSFSFGDSETDGFSEVVFNHLLDARERIEAAMTSEFGINIDDDTEMDAFLEPFRRCLMSTLSGVPYVDREQLIKNYRTGARARELLSFAFAFSDLAFRKLQEGDIRESLALNGMTFETFGRFEHALYEREFVSLSAQRKAQKSHKEDHLMKDMALKWFEENRHQYSSKDEAAEKIAGKIVPYRFRTVRSWLKNK